MGRSKQVRRRSEKIIKLLEAIGDGIELVALSRRYQRAFVEDGLGGVKRVRDAVEKKLLREQVAYLKRQCLIEESLKGERLICILTDEGKRQLLRAALLKAPLRRDGQLAFIIFDIPESERASRDFFRQFIREVGFRKVQQSVWATNRDVSDALLQFIHAHELASWVNVFVGAPILVDKNFPIKQSNGR